MGVETGWRECIKCAEMFFWGSVAGTCATGGSHDTGAYYRRYIGIIDPIAPDTYLSGIKTMPGWRRCQYCQCMFYVATLAERMTTVFYPESAELKVCPGRGGGGKHDATGSPNYLVTISWVEDDPAGRFMIGGWQRCGKCYALFEDTGEGVCVTDGKPHSGVGTWLSACQEPFDLAKASTSTPTGV